MELAPQTFELMCKCIERGAEPLSYEYVSKYDWLLHFCMREIPSESSLGMRLLQLAVVLNSLKHFAIRFLAQILAMLDSLVLDRPDVSDKVISVMTVLFANCMPRLLVHRALAESILLKCPSSNLKLHASI